MNMLKIRLAAKTDVGLARSNNEDNFQVAADLSAATMQWKNDDICSLGNKGALLVVADGMGGMNAGEVASELAIKSIRSAFSPEKLTPEVMQSRYSIEKYMNNAIVEADTCIKREAKANPTSRGMGTTIVIAWLLNDKLYVSWCGDSRAYVYNPQAGLHQITKDHSYVQQLVDKGSISRYDAFDYPESNIITRSLGDGPTKAKPESLLHPYDLCENDIILLCTDGLCGMIRDNEIESVIRSNERSMETLSTQLIQAACDASGADNITLCLCQVVQGGSSCNPEVFQEYENRLNGPTPQNSNTVSSSSAPTDSEEGYKHNPSWILCLIFVAAILLSFVGGYFTGHILYPYPFKKDVCVTDSLESNPGSPGSVSTISISEENKEKEEPEADSEDTPERRNNIQSTQSGNSSSILRTPIEIQHQKKDSSAQDKLTPAKPQPQDSLQLNPVSREDTYIVQQGDTYSRLASRYHISVEELQRINKGKELKTGDTIKVPKKK